MSLWIQVDTQRSSNRKTYVLAELLGRGAGDLFGGRDDVAWLAVAIALLDDFWAWAAEHHPNGDVTDAHPTSIRKALLHWLAGTEWATKDARELLVKSGHIDRRTDGRLTIHDWLEWTGGSVLKLAKDRKRKRIARSKGAGTRPRTDIRKGRGHSTPGPVLAVQGSAVQSSPVQSSSKAAAAAVSDEPEAQLRQRLPVVYHDALDGYLKSAPYPIAVIQTILAEGPDTGTNGAAGKSWDVIGRALLELRAAGEGFRPALFRAYVTRLMRAPASPAAAPSGYEGTAFREAKTDD